MTGNFEIETHWPVGPGPITIITSNDRQHSESESTVTVPVYYVTSNPKTLRIFKCSIVFYRYINILNSMGCQGRRPPGASGTVRPAFQFGRPGPAGGPCWLHRSAWVLQFPFKNCIASLRWSWPWHWRVLRLPYLFRVRLQVQVGRQAWLAAEPGRWHDF